MDTDDSPFRWTISADPALNCGPDPAKFHRNCPALQHVPKHAYSPLHPSTDCDTGRCAGETVPGPSRGPERLVDAGRENSALRLQRDALPRTRDTPPPVVTLATTSSSPRPPLPLQPTTAPSPPLPPTTPPLPLLGPPSTRNTPPLSTPPPLSRPRIRGAQQRGCRAL